RGRRPRARAGQLDAGRHRRPRRACRIRLALQRAGADTGAVAAGGAAVAAESARTTLRPVAAGGDHLLPVLPAAGYGPRADRQGSLAQPGAAVGAASAGGAVRRMVAVEAIQSTEN